MRPVLCLVAATLTMPGCTGLLGQTREGSKAQAPNSREALKPQGKLDPSTPIAVVGNSVITLGDLEYRISQTMPQFRVRFSSAEGRRMLLNTMIDSRLLYEEAVRRGMDKDPVLRERLQAYTEQFLGGELTKKILQEITATEQEAKAYYDSHPQEFGIPEQVKARHILLTSEEEAKGVLKQIQEGASFEELARSKSKDDRTAANGGELGLFRRGVMAPEFEKVAFELQPGAISGVVATGTGFHIIQVEEKRPAQLNSFESEKLRVMNKLKVQKQRDSYEAFKNQLKQDAKIVIREELLQPQEVTVPEATSRGARPSPARSGPPPK